MIKRSMTEAEDMTQPERTKISLTIFWDNALYLSHLLFKRLILGCFIVNNVFEP